MTQKKSPNGSKPADALVSNSGEKESAEAGNVEDPGVTELTRALEDAPPSVRGLVEMMAVSTSTRTGHHHPVFNKLTEEHVGKFLDYCHEDDRQQYELERTNRWFHLCYVVLGLGMFVFLIVYLAPTDKDLLADVIRLTIAFVGGVGGGFGLKAYIDKKS